MTALPTLRCRMTASVCAPWTMQHCTAPVIVVLMCVRAEAHASASVTQRLPSLLLPTQQLRHQSAQVLSTSHVGLGDNACRAHSVVNWCAMQTQASQPHPAMASVWPRSAPSLLPEFQAAAVPLWLCSAHLRHLQALHARHSLTPPLLPCWAVVHGAQQMGRHSWCAWVRVQRSSPAWTR